MAPTIEDSNPGVVLWGVPPCLETYRRTPVRYRTDEAPGTIVVDTPRRFLYPVQPNGNALRDGIGDGRDGFQWNGRVTRKDARGAWRQSNRAAIRFSHRISRLTLHAHRPLTP